MFFCLTDAILYLKIGPNLCPLLSYYPAVLDSFSYLGRV
jgi:hypothetical protein